MRHSKCRDRIGEYLIPYLEQYVFDELSESYLEKAGIADILTGVPVPIKKDRDDRAFYFCNCAEYGFCNGL